VLSPVSVVASVLRSPISSHDILFIGCLLYARTSLLSVRRHLEITHLHDVPPDSSPQTKPNRPSALRSSCSQPHASRSAHSPRTPSGPSTRFETIFPARSRLHPPNKQPPFPQPYIKKPQTSFPTRSCHPTRPRRHTSCKQRPSCPV